MCPEDVAEVKTEDEVFQDEMESELASMGFNPDGTPADTTDDADADSVPTDTVLDDTDDGDHQLDADMDTDPADTGDEPPADTPEPNPEMDKLVKKVENLQGVLDRQAQELGNTRQAAVELQKIQDALQNNPQIFNMLFSQQPGAAPAQGVQPPPQGQEYDFTDPNAIAQLVSSQVQTILQQRDREQNQQVAEQSRRSLLASTEAERLKMVADGTVTEDDLVSYQKSVVTAIKGGKADHVAYVYANHEALIEAARKEGADEAIAKLKKQGTQPPSLSKATATPRPGAAGKTSKYDKMSEDELQEAFKTADPEGTEFVKILKAVDKWAKKK